MSQLINKYIKASVDSPKIVVTISILLTLLSTFLASSLPLKTSNLDLIDPKDAVVSRFIDFATNFGTPNSFVVVLRGEEQGALHKATDIAAAELRKITDVKRVFSQAPNVSKPGQNQYFQSHDGKQSYLFVQPSDPRSDVIILGPLGRKIRTTLQHTLSSHPDISFGITGIPQYALDDETTIKNDISSLSLVSFFAVFLIFLFGFHHFRRPLIANIVVLVSVIITLGLISWYPGHLTLLSAPFAAMIFGLGIDYAIHIINHTEELRHQGYSEKEAVTEALISLRSPLLAAALTTSGGFFVLTQSGFLGFAELGIIAGASLLICLLLMYTLLPALLVLFAQNNAVINKPDNRIGICISRLQRTPIAPMLIIAILLALFAKPVSFDANYLNLQPIKSEAVRLEKDMIANSSYSPYFAAFVTSSLDKLQQITHALHAADTVATVRSLTDFIPTELSTDPRLVTGFLQMFPEEFIGLFHSKDGRYAAYAFPKGDIWNPEVEKRFLEQMKAIDPAVTGMPFIGNLMIQRSKHALTITAQLAVVVLFIVITLHCRHFYQTIIVLSTPILTIVILEAAMGLFGITFNPINVMALPLVLGIAVDEGLHLVDHFIQSAGNMEKTLYVTGRSIFLTSITSFVSFAALTFTSHRGLQSFCLVTCIGITIGLILSIFLLPWLLTHTKNLTLSSTKTIQP